MRVLRLLETGSTQLIRNTAAQQLGDVQKQHPDELFNLLTRVLPFLKSKSWDTRTAAAKAIAGIVENASHFDPNGDDGNDGIRADDSITNDANHGPSELPALVRDDIQLRLKTLDLTAILTNGKKLLGSGGQEQDYAIASLDPATRLDFQRRASYVTLGLSGSDVDEQISKILREMNIPKTDANATRVLPTMPNIDTTESMISDDQAVRSPSPFTPGGDPSQSSIDASGLSKRQLNQLKRKKKMDAR